ncbi:protein phosphatase 2C domain-containing protein [Desulfococcaceae bacterium HSG9]|nr:protein phosphatase 2C domain-containing protein [Desulfococcaceae bacterium HSG9]
MIKMQFETAYASHIGGRDEQQDRAEIFISRNNNSHLLVVADGMGGHQGGSLAAQAVIQTAASLCKTYQDNSIRPEQFLEQLCFQGHNAVNRIGREQNLNPYTTIVALFLKGRKAHWVHIGDSRFYHFRQNKMLYKTSDHSAVQVLVDMGEITEAEMAHHPVQNRLTRCIGGDKTPDPMLDSATVKRGDGFLLCTDGVWETVAEEEMAEALSSADFTQKASALVEKAAQRGGEMGDNATVAIARCTGRRFWIPFLSRA